ncbi:hypothetical protein KKC94_05975 [Patescibacteria group bacterium]|nr:hypothetical protein [Patescibacteria group bacterium]
MLERSSHDEKTLSYVPMNIHFIQSIEGRAASDWREATSQEIAQYFGTLSEGATVEVRQYDFGNTFVVTTEEETRLYLPSTYI